MEKTFTIQKQTPGSNWYTIHRGYDKDSADAFLTDMAAGGYDGSGVDGTCDLDNGTAHHWEQDQDGSQGDMIAFRAVEE